jgi:hypothetical protein
MITIAKAFPSIKFLAFTKKYDLDYSKIPNNLSIVLSAWPNWPLPKHGPIAFMQDGTEDRYNDQDTLECQGCCEHCSLCWYLSQLNKNVVFHKH